MLYKVNSLRFFLFALTGVKEAIVVLHEQYSIVF